MSPKHLNHALPSITTALVIVSFAARAALGAEESARDAAEFSGSIGFCTHWSYGDTPYGSGYDQVRAKLVELGAHHVRDGFNSRIVDLANAGIKTTLVVDADRTPAQIVEEVKRLNATTQAVDAIEGPNEPDFFWRGGSTFPPKSYNGHGPDQGDNGIIEGVIAFQKDLYAAVKADPGTAKIPVIGPSLGKTYGYDTKSPYGKGTLTDSVDFGNFHPYPGGNPFSVPFPYGGLEKYLWHGSQPSANMDEFPYAFDVYAPPFAPKPMSATETGYSTYKEGTSEAAQAKYLPRLFCEYFRKGIVRTFDYEFVDEFAKPDDREANFGVLRHDLVPKPAYTAVQRLLAVLQSPDSAATGFTPGKLTFSIDVQPVGDYKKTQYVHHLLLQKKSGAFDLLIWHEIALEDTSKRPFRALPEAPPLPCVVSFAKPVQNAVLYIPNDSADPVKTFGPGGKVEFGVLDRVMILELTP